MSTPTWLLNAIHATKSAGVPTVPSPENTPWVRDERPKVLINTGVVKDVPTVPTVPNEMQHPIDELGIIARQHERRHAKVRGLAEWQSACRDS